MTFHNENSLLLYQQLIDKLMIVLRLMLIDLWNDQGDYLQFVFLLLLLMWVNQHVIMLLMSIQAKKK